MNSEGKKRRGVWLLRTAPLLLLGMFLTALAQQQPAKPVAAPAPAATPAAEIITIKLVTDFESGKLVSDLEEFQPVTTTLFDAQGSREITLGEKCVLWVRNAHVDGKHFFERFYEGKYIGRRSQVEIKAAELPVGEHVIEPGHHVFTVTADGKLESKDPNVRIDGKTVLLKMHRVTVLTADAAQEGPPEFRKVPDELGVFQLAPEFKVEAGSLPNPTITHDPQKPAADGRPASPLTNLISHPKQFYPLSIWLPANQVGQGYLLYPSWQAFQITPDGVIELGAAGAPRVTGIELNGEQVVIPYRKFSGRVETHTALSGGVGAVSLAKEMNFSAMLAPRRFRAGVGQPPEDFYLAVDNDFARRPHKFFVADNTLADPDAVRLMALEWERPVFTRGQQATVALRLLETAGKSVLQKPEVRMQYAPYEPSNPKARVWQPVSVAGWTNGRDAGDLKFTIPDAPFGFYVFRVQIFETGDPGILSTLSAEIPGSIIESGQQGSASFATNKGRNAFIAGEEITADLILRSTAPRPAGERKIELIHPDGATEAVNVSDSGATWFTQGFRLPATRTAQLAPGAYQLTVRDLPEGIAAAPFRFDLVDRRKPSLFHVVKSSKYTKPMNDLEPSHLQGDEPNDLDRAMRTIADLGFTRVDLMSYMTNRHLRTYTWREDLAGADPRLPAPESVYNPSPRDQMLNACVRNQLQFSDVWLSYGDFHLPRQIESYLNACERWIAREVQAMRHSPAFDGLMLYDEMYQSAVTGIVKEHQKYFTNVRARLAEDQLGATPAKIEQAFSKYLQRPPSQRDPAALAQMIKYGDWQQHSWNEFATRVVNVGKQLAPHARFGTYTRTWGSPGGNDEIFHGYPPDLFKPLDIISHVHYADNATCWVNICMLAQILRSGTDKTLYINLPLLHEIRTNWDGQYQRQMAFALLAQGANGIAHWGTPHSFGDDANPGTAVGRESTAPLNFDILRPFGEIIDRTRDGYRKVGIVSTLNQHTLSQFKQMPVANQTEGIWTACWRLGYPAVFLREDEIRSSLDNYSVVFVPGVRFAGELDESVAEALKRAAAAGVKVIVEQDSVLDLPGVTRLPDWSLNSNFVGTYFPTWMDDELDKVYQKSQPIVDYLRPKFREWNVEPAASGPFQVGPTWRNGGAIDYLVMANFDDPAYGHTVKQQMAKPVVMPLTISPRHGSVAYDLLAQQELPVTPVKTEEGRDELGVSLDMRRMQGAFVAFLPERIARLEVQHALSAGGSTLRLQAALIGEKQTKLDGVFPTRIIVRDGTHEHTYYRVLGRNLAAELDLPRGRAARHYTIEVREGLSGRTATFETDVAALEGNSLELIPQAEVDVPYPNEVRDFLANAKDPLIVPSAAIAGTRELAEKLAKALQAKGVQAEIAKDPESAYRVPVGDPDAEDPLGDGFHSWRSGQEVIAPAAIVDRPVILLGGARSAYLVDVLASHGYLSHSLLGRPDAAVRPTLQVARKGLHYAYDTLCLNANDTAGLDRALQQLLAELPSKPLPAESKFGDAATARGEAHTDVQPAIAATGTNEQVQDVQFDAAGNLYAITWGHGKNLYSLTPDGQLRFSRFLPEMGANRLTVATDRLFVYTAAGARLYELTLDNQPIAQARFNMDPGSTYYTDSYHLSTIDFQHLPAQRKLLHNMGDRMRVLDEQFQILAEWRGEEFVDKDVSDEPMRRSLRGFAPSPDGQRVAQLETSKYFTKTAYLDQEVFDTHLVVRDLTGKLLFEHKNLDNYSEVSASLPERARVEWPANADGPVVFVRGARWKFPADLTNPAITPYRPALYPLEGERRLVRDGRWLLYYDTLDHQQCRFGPFPVLPTYVRLSPDGASLATLDEQGLVRLFRTADGGELSHFNVPENGQVLVFTPDSKRLVLGGFRGTLRCFDLAGQPAWPAVSLGAANDILGTPLPLFDASFPDYTERLWPSSRDAEGELDAVVRIGVNRLENGDCEADGGWLGDAVAYHPEGYQSGRSLKVGPGMVGQEVSGFLGQHATWVLEFFYRAADPSQPAELLAGVQAESDFPDSVARHFHAGADWRFGRVVAKNGAHCKKLAAGFVAEQGAVLVDHVLFRQIRFPSVNHLHYEPLHAVKPVVLDNPLFASKYDPFGGLREQAPNKVLIEMIKTGALNLVESGFLQNARLNEVGSNWYIQPLSMDPHISMGMNEARWISTVALYFNVYDEANVTPHFDIFAVDPESNKDKLVASVRHNTQVFRLVKFPPVKTPLVKIRLVNSIARLRTVTEVELYGPLSGREGTPGFVDAEGQNTYMGDFTRVDKRKLELPPQYAAPIVKGGAYTDDLTWFAPLAQPLVSEDRFFIARTLGKNSAFKLEEPIKDVYLSRAGGLGYTPFGALYGGLILRCGNDGKLYCINPESGTELWSVALGERLFGCPVAIADDIFVTSDTSRLYQIDFASGMIMKEIGIDGVVYGSLTTDGTHLLFITDNGFLNCYTAADFQLKWQVPIASFTDSTPAVDAGVVYLADQKGQALAVSVSDGAVRWRANLEDEFTRCPVVTVDKIAFGCRGGTLVVVNRSDGRILWSKKTGSRFDYEPLILADAAAGKDRILYFRDLQATLADGADGREAPLQFYPATPANAPPAIPKDLVLQQDPVVPLGYYKGSLFIIERPADKWHNQMYMNHPWHPTAGGFVVLKPVPPPMPKEEKK